MYGYTEYLWNEAKKEGINKTLLKAYANMKNANLSDGDIRSMLGISIRKLQEIKRLFNESIA